MTDLQTSVDADLRLLADTASTLDQVDAAVARVDAGTYGRCATCATAIADADLAADPLLTTCADHRPVAPVPLLRPT